MDGDMLKRIVETYDSDVLAQECDDPKKRKRLCSGLEATIRKVHSGHAAQDSALARNIDYAAVGEIAHKAGYKSVLTMIRNYLEDLGIKTYGDLVNATREVIESNIKEGYETRRTSFPLRYPRSEYTSDIGSGGALACLYAHLHSVGIKVFGVDYTDWQLAIYTNVFGRTERQKELLESPLSTLQIWDANVQGRLEMAGVKTVRQLLQKTAAELRKTYRFTKSETDGLKIILEKEGFSFRVTSCSPLS